MAYFIGRNLVRKIAEFSLEDLDKKLNDVIAGTDNWTGDVILTVGDIDSLEPLRIIVYSLLHKYGQKESFQVKMFPSMGRLSIVMKQEVRRDIGMMVAGGSPIKDDGPASGEDCAVLLDDNIT